MKGGKVGQKRISVVDLSTTEEPVKKVSQKRAVKTVGKVVKTGKRAGRIADKSEPLAEFALESQAPEEIPELVKEEEPAEKPRARQPRLRSRRYRLASAVVDGTKRYPPDEAFDLVKKTTLSRFDGTISAHLNLTESNLTVDVPFPYPTGKKTRVAIASDDLLKKIEDKTIEFDLLLATPEMMKKLTKVAKILGPLGLMPNPKTGTITDNPEKRKQELESGMTQVRSESKFPLMHVVIGKTSQETKELTENLAVLMRAVQPRRVKKLTLASTMSPGIKVDLTSFQTSPTL